MAIGDMIATRDGFGDEIVELGRENRNIYVVDADIARAARRASLSRLCRSST